MADLQLPSHLAARGNRGLAAQLALSLPTGSVPRVSIMGNRFTLIDAAGNEKQVGAMSPDVGLYLDLCIIDSNPHISKVYYDKGFDPNAEGEMPACFSDNGIGASAQAQKPQSASCKTCPQNQWGSEVSRITGKPVKACNDVQKVAVVVPGTGDMVFLMRIPPVSLKFLGKYIQEISSISAGGRKVDVSDLITRVYFQKDIQGVLGFTPAAFVDPETMAIGDKAFEAKATDQLVGKNDRPYEGAIALPPAAGQAEERRLPPPAQVQAQPAFNSEANVIASGGTPGTTQQAGTLMNPKPRGRPKKTEQVQEAPATQAPFISQAPTSTLTPAGNGTAPAVDDGEDVPAFLKRNVPPMGDTPAKPAGSSFGMQAAAPAPDDMQARIAAVLGMKT